jgi:proline iminopeptidase
MTTLKIPGPDKTRLPSMQAQASIAGRFTVPLILTSFALMGLITMTISSCKSGIGTQCIKEGFIQVEGGRIWYRIHGTDKKLTPLLVLHGGPGGTHYYLDTLRELATERPVIFYDQLGCGLSDRPSDTSLFNLERFVRELQRVRDELHLDRVHILGQSWGTMLGVRYTLDNPGTGIRSLVLSGPFLSAPRWAADQKMLLRAFPDSIQDIVAQCDASGKYGDPRYQDAMNQFYKRHVCRIDPWPDCVNLAFANMGALVYSHMWGASEFSATGTLQTVDLSNELPKLSLPVLITCGQYDEAVPATCEYYRGLITGAQLLAIPEASHMHHVENPGLYLSSVRNFLHSSD